MFRSISTAALATAALVLGAAPAGAGAQHDLFVEEYDGSETHPAEENPCGPWAMTIHEVRSGSARLVTPPGGQVEDETHVNGAVYGQVTIVPGDPTLPTYTGSYREKINGIITGYDAQEGDLVRVSQFRLRIPLTGSDGSSLVLAFSGKYTFNAHGELIVARDRMSCS